MTPEYDGVLGFDRVRDLYKHCIRLSASNKINAKNAFDLQLIDYMQDIVNSNGEQMINFKMASSTLDAGAKIYSNRVDCIQSEAQKVASSILMALDGDAKNAGSQDDGHEDGDTSRVSDRMNDSSDSNVEARGKAKKKRTTRSIKTVVEDTNQLDAKLDRVVLGDPYLDSLSQDYDMSCPAALVNYNQLTQPLCCLTIESDYWRRNYLPKDAKVGQAIEYPDGGESSVQTKEGSGDQQESGGADQTLVDNDGDSPMKDVSEATQTDGSQTTTSFETANPKPQNVEMVSLITKHVNCAQIMRNNVITQKLCPRLDNFLFNDRTTTLSGLESNSDETMLSLGNDLQPINSSHIVGGIHQFDPQLYNENAANDYGDDHFGDACSNAGDADGFDKDENDLIPNLDKIAASKPTDYGYASEVHRLLNTWAGPHAWKVAKNPGTTRKDGAPRSTRKRARLEAQPIDYSEKFSANVLAAGAKDIRHSADQIRRWKKPLIPQDHNSTEQSIQETLFTPFLRPEDTYHCMKTPADALKLVDKDHDYSKAGRDDTMTDPPSPGMGGFDDVHDDSDDEFRADPMIENNEVAVLGDQLNMSSQAVDHEFAGENLIEQPYTVAQVSIPFAKVAKKMDVRKLKRVMWDLLLPLEKRLELEEKQADATVIGNNHQDSTNNTTLVSGDEHNETVMVNGDTESTLESVKKNPSPTPSESAVHLAFSHLYGELPVRVSSKMADDLSQPIAFVTLLHLANEKNLKLIPKQDLKDFLIEQDELI